MSDGRDQGSTVFPNAEAKFLLEASLETRAERRLLELAVDRESVDIAEVMDNIRARDAVDSKQWLPLLTDRRAKVIDTTDMTVTEVVDHLAAAVASIARGSSGGG